MYRSIIIIVSAGYTEGCLFLWDDFDMWEEGAGVGAMSGSDHAIWF